MAASTTKEGQQPVGRTGQLTAIASSQHDPEQLLENLIHFIPIFSHYTQYNIDSHLCDTGNSSSHNSDSEITRKNCIKHDGSYCFGSSNHSGIKTYNRHPRLLRESKISFACASGQTFIWVEVRCRKNKLRPLSIHYIYITLQLAFPFLSSQATMKICEKFIESRCPLYPIACTTERPQRTSTGRHFDQRLLVLGSSATGGVHVDLIIIINSTNK